VNLSYLMVDVTSRLHANAVAAVLTATSSNWHPDESEVFSDWLSTPSHVDEVRYLAFDRTEPVGYARVGTYRYVVDPGRIQATVRVLPSHQQKGVGAHLVEAITPWIAAQQPRELWAATDIDADGNDVFPGGVVFAEKYGLQRRESRFESVLDTSSTELADVDAALEPCRRQGINVTSIEQLLSEAAWRDRDWEQLLYEVDSVALADEPTEQAGDPVPFDAWQADFVNNRDRAGLIVAVHSDQFVGLSLHWLEEQAILVASTGVLRAWRGRGIARALKLAGAAYGHKKGLPLRAMNQDNNPSIVKLNQSLGFVRRSGQTYWRKQW
jgi:mycothiol synthase